MIFLSLILGLVIGALSVIFALQNVFSVTVTFMFWHMTTSLSVLISLAVLTGILITCFLSIPGAVKNIMEVAELTKENKKLKDEIERARRMNYDTSSKSEVVPLLGDLI